MYFKKMILIRGEIIERAIEQEEKYKKALEENNMESYFLAYGMHSAYESAYNIIIKHSEQ